MFRTLTRIAALATACASLWLAGCGGGGGSAPVATPPNITAAAGGTVVSDDGRVTLVVPPGAAPRDMTLRIVPATPDGPPQYGLLAGYGYAFEGDGGPLSAAAELRMHFEPGVLPTGAAKAGTAGSTTGRRRALAGSAIRIPPLTCNSDLGLTAVPVDPNDYWGAWYCVKFPREPVLATVTRTAVVELGACVFESALRIAACQTLDLTPQIFGALIDPIAPTVTVTADPGSLTVAGDVVLSANAADNKAVASVAISLTRSVGGVVDPASVETTAFNLPPYQLTRAFTHLDNGEWTVVAAASDFNKNTTITDGLLTIVVNIPPPLAEDATPPVVALGASSTAVTVGDTLVLSATASDNVGVTLVEFFKGAVKIGEQVAPPYELTPAAFTAGDVGSPQVFTARAHDAAGNTTTSAALTVTVSAVSTGDVYVNAANGLDSHAGTSGAPFKTLAKAFSVVGNSGTVWLQNGSFTLASEGTDVIAGRTVPAGITVRAVNPLGAVVGFPVKFAGNGTLSGVQLDASGNGSVQATAGSGTVTLTKLQWVKLGSINTAAAILLGGDVKATLDTGGDPAHEYVAAAGVASLANVDGNAEFTINGGHVDRVSGGGVGGMLRIGGNAKMVLNGVSWTNLYGAVVSPSVIRIDGTAPTVTLVNTTLDLNSAPPDGGGNGCIQGVPSVVPSGGAPVITLDASFLKRCPGDGIHIRAGTPTIVLKNGSQIANAGFHGLRTGVFAPSNAAVPTISINNSQIVNSGRSGVELLAGGSLAMTGATISNNGLALANGGVRLIGAFDYGLSMRGSTVSDNAGDAGSGGVVLQGTAASVFDLGSQASPGGNTLRNNGAASTGLRAAVAAGVTVLAVGNTWNADVQGADASGLYTAASPLCGASPCNLGTGSGVNFAITGGMLRLVDD